MSLNKIEKEFCLIGDSLNCHTFRLVTSGLQKERFKPSGGFLMCGQYRRFNPYLKIV